MSPTSSTSTSISRFPALRVSALRESALRVSVLRDQVSAAQGRHRHPDLVAGAAVGAADVVELNVIRQTDLDSVPWRCRNLNGRNRSWRSLDVSDSPTGPPTQSMNGEEP